LFPRAAGCDASISGYEVRAFFARAKPSAHEARAFAKTFLNTHANLVFLAFAGVVSQRPGG
jgi:hypothetical protein